MFQARGFIGQEARIFIGNFIKYLGDKFPNEGRGIPQLALGNLLHPFYRGAGIDDQEVKTKLILDTIEAHPSTSAYKAEKDKNQSRLTIHGQVQPQLEFDDDEFEFEQKLQMAVMTQPVRLNSPTNIDMPPLKEEFNKYFSYSRAETADVDCVIWWRGMATHLPKLTQVAMGIFSMPCSSASCERAFSTAGKVVSESRISLSSERMSQLVFINKNYDSVIDHCDVLFVRRTDEITTESQDSQEMVRGLAGLEEDRGMEFIRLFPSTSTPKKKPTANGTPSKLTPSKARTKWTPNRPHKRQAEGEESASLIACTPGQEVPELSKQKAKRARQEDLVKKHAKLTMAKKKMSRSRIEDMLEKSDTQSESSESY